MLPNDPLAYLLEVSTTFDSGLQKGKKQDSENEKLTSIFRQTLEKDTPIEEKLMNLHERFLEVEVDKIEEENVGKLEALATRLETIRNHLIDTLKEESPEDERIEELERIHFPHVKALATFKREFSETAEKNIPYINVKETLLSLVEKRKKEVGALTVEVEELVDTTVKDLTKKSLERAIQETREGLRQIEQKIAELRDQESPDPQERNALHSALAATNHAITLLINHVRHDMVFTKKERTETISALEKIAEEIRNQDAKLPEIKRASTPPPKIPTSHKFSVASAANALAIPIITEVALSAIHEGTVDVPTVALRALSPFAAAFATHEICKMLPPKLASYTSWILQPITQAMMHIYGVPYVRGAMAYPVSTQPEFVPYEMATRTQTNTTVPELTPYVQPVEAVNPQTAVFTNFTDFRPQDIPAQAVEPTNEPILRPPLVVPEQNVTAIPTYPKARVAAEEREVATPTISPPPQTAPAQEAAQTVSPLPKTAPPQEARGMWGWTAEKIARFWQGFAGTPREGAWEELLNEIK